MSSRGWHPFRAEGKSGFQKCQRDGGWRKWKRRAHEVAEDTLLQKGHAQQGEQQEESMKQQPPEKQTSGPLVPFCVPSETKAPVAVHDPGQDNRRPHGCPRSYNKKKSGRKPFQFCVPCYVKTGNWVVKALTWPNGDTMALEGHTKARKCPRYPDPTQREAQAYAAAFRRETRAYAAASRREDKCSSGALSSVLKDAAVKAFQANTTSWTEKEIIAHMENCEQTLETEKQGRFI